MEKGASCPPTRLLPEYSDDDDGDEVEAVKAQESCKKDRGKKPETQVKQEQVVIHARDLRDTEWEYDPERSLGQRNVTGGFDRVSRSRHQLGYIAQVARESEKSITEASRKSAESRKATRLKYGW